MAELIFFGLALPIGLSGVYLAFTTRIGWVEMTFTDEDRTTLGYRIGREVAIREFGFWGNRFSRKYFDSYQVGRLNQAVDDKQQPKANPE